MPFLLHSGSVEYQRLRTFPKAASNPILEPKQEKGRPLLRQAPEGADNKSDSNQISADWKTKHNVVLPNGVRAHSVRSEEYQLEPIMNRKARLTTLTELRNGIDVAVLGDKPYRSPEMSSKFYHQEGLVPGSTIKPRNKTNMLPTSKTLAVGLNGIVKYNEKQRLKELQSDLSLVKSLSVTFIYYLNHCAPLKV